MSKDSQKHNPRSNIPTENVDAILNTLQSVLHSLALTMTFNQIMARALAGKETWNRESEYTHLYVLTAAKTTELNGRLYCTIMLYERQPMRVCVCVCVYGK